MLDDIFEANNTILYEVKITDHKLDYVKDTNGNRIKICKLSEIKCENKSVTDLCSFMGKGKTPTYVESSNIQVIKSGQSKGIYHFDLKDKYYTSNESISPDDERILLTGDLVINTTGTGTAGRVTVYIQEDKQLKTPDSHMCIMRPKDNIFYKYFLQLFLHIGFSNLENMASGTGGLIELGMPIIKKIKLKIPIANSIEKSLQLQMSITKYIEDKMLMIDERDNTIDIMLSLLQVEKDEIIDEVFINGSSTIRIGDFLKRSDEKTLIDNNSMYTRVTVKINNQGTRVRDIELGSNIRTKEQWIVKEGQFLLSKIDARNGAFGMVTKEIDGAIVTNDFPTYNIDIHKISIDFLLLFTSSTEFIRICELASKGVTGRKRIKEDILLNIEVALPDIIDQEEILRTINQQFKVINTKKDSLLIMKELLEIGRKKVLNGVFNGN